jgi:hypothetical protein
MASRGEAAPVLGCRVRHSARSRRIRNAAVLATTGRFHRRFGKWQTGPSPPGTARRAVRLLADGLPQDIDPDIRSTFTGAGRGDLAHRDRRASPRNAFAIRRLRSKQLNIPNERILGAFAPRRTRSRGIAGCVQASLSAIWSMPNGHPAQEGEVRSRRNLNHADPLQA